jgi:hypothetical protein
MHIARHKQVGKKRRAIMPRCPNTELNDSLGSLASVSLSLFLPLLELPVVFNLWMRTHENETHVSCPTCTLYLKSNKCSTTSCGAS